MLFHAQYVTSPKEFLEDGQVFEDLDIVFSEIGFRIGIRTRDRRDPEGDPYTDILISSVLVSEPEGEAAKAFQNPDQFRPRRKLLDTEGFPKDLSFHSDRYPKAYWSFLDATCKRLDQETNQSLGVLFWRTRTRGGPSALHSSEHRIHWQDGNHLDRVNIISLRSWQPPPHGLVISGEASPKTLKLAEDERQDIIRIRTPGTGEPLGHSLLQEAWRLVETNPRSALVIGVAAAEARIKELIVAIEPSTEWLVENIPSPPLVMLVSNYLKTLDVKLDINGRAPTPQNRWKKKLEEAVKLRNKIVHGRKVPLRSEEVIRLLKEVSDLLYLCDYYSGEAWALSKLDEQNWVALQE